MPKTFKRLITARKDFSKKERIDYARRLERIESLKAQERMKNPTQIFAEGETAQIVAQKVGIGSKETYRKEKVIVDNKNFLDPSDFTEWDEGKLSTNKAFQKIKAEFEQKEDNSNDIKRGKKEMRRILHKMS